MATLLMIESWLQSTGVVLPPLINDRGDEYVLVTRDPSVYPRGHPVRHFATDMLVTETNDIPALTASAKRYATANRIDGVLTTCDYYLEAAAACAHALHLPGPQPGVMRTATRKDLVRETTARGGVPTPAYSVADSWESARAAAELIGYPLVAKPVDLNSGTSVHLVDDERALKDAFWDITSHTHNTRAQRLHRLMLIEENLAGPEVSIEAVTIGGTTHIIGVTSKETDPESLIETGHQFPAVVDRDTTRSAIKHVRDALSALGFTHGLSHTEVMLTPDGPRIVEINPRQPGGYIFELVGLVAGVDILEMLIDLALGATPTTDTARDDAALPASAAISFVMPPLDDATIARAGSRLDGDPTVHRWELTPSTTQHPTDNNERAGYVIAIDPDGLQALDRAHEALSRSIAPSAS